MPNNLFKRQPLADFPVHTDPSVPLPCSRPFVHSPSIWKHLLCARGAAPQLGHHEPNKIPLLTACSQVGALDAVPIDNLIQVDAAQVELAVL